MSATLRITCFTDMKDSTKLTEELGHQDYMPILKEHLAAGKALAAIDEGDYVKNIGDSHMITFTSVDSALRFACHILEYYSEQPGFSQQLVKVRVGLFSGVIEELDHDVFGSGINQAARVQGNAQVEEILMNRRLSEDVMASLGRTQWSQFIESAGLESDGFSAGLSARRGPRTAHG